MHSASRMLSTMVGCAASFLLVAAAIASGGQTVPDKTRVEANNATKVNELNWWKNAVIYEVYPRSFQDTNGDGERAPMQWKRELCGQAAGGGSEDSRPQDSRVRGARVDWVRGPEA